MGEDIGKLGGVFRVTDVHRGEQQAALAQQGTFHTQGRRAPGGAHGSSPGARWRERNVMSPGGRWYGG